LREQTDAGEALQLARQGASGKPRAARDLPTVKGLIWVKQQQTQHTATVTREENSRQ
jgi:hypothetical protein